MTRILTDTQLDSSAHRQLCYQGGFLPVPLRNVPPGSLGEFDLYLRNGESYLLYNSIDLKFSNRDYHRLLASGVEFVYVAVRDHQAYYRTIERYLENIISDPETQKEKKAEILYCTSVELANQLMEQPPEQEEITRTKDVARATVKMVIEDTGAFGHLFDIFNHDFYTATHMVNVCTSVVHLAWKCGVTDEKVLRKLGAGAMLHDIGKIFVPSEILNTPKDLTNEQYSLIQTHVERGREHLREVADLSPEIIDVVAHHHERMDGSGYPKGLKGDQISLLGRLVGVVDTFEAMTSVRPYREYNFSVEDALQYLEDQAPEKYDREIVKIFTKLMENILGLEQETFEIGTSDNSGVRGDNGNKSQRNGQRHYFRILAQVRNVNRVKGELSLGATEDIIVHNLSYSGVGLLSPGRMSPGKNICISFTDAETNKPIHLIATVVRCVEHGDGWFTVGTQFHVIQSKQFIDSVKK